jgi:hypothetical protein
MKFLPGEARALQGGEVRLVNCMPKLAEMLSDGISGQWGFRVSMKDGLKFLEALKYAFTGSVIRATDVQQA